LLVVEVVDAAQPFDSWCAPCVWAD
jgi:hypothetical protein